MKAEDYEKELNELQQKVSIKLSEQINLNLGLQFVTLEEKKAKEFPDLLEYRNEITGNVFDFYPISILSDGQIEGYSIEGILIGGYPINMSQLPLDSKIALLSLIEETI